MLISPILNCSIGSISYGHLLMRKCHHVFYLVAYLHYILLMLVYSIFIFAGKGRHVFRLTAQDSYSWSTLSRRWRAQLKCSFTQHSCQDPTLNLWGSTEVENIEKESECHAMQMIPILSSTIKSRDQVKPVIWRWCTLSTPRQLALCILFVKAGRPIICSF